MTKAVMVMGTASDVGKSVVAAGLCRLLHRRGIRVAPFKAQNMSLNSFVTIEGGEMGRAQVVQAEACGLLPHVDMNPILLKPEGDNCSQVIVHGKVWGKHDAQDYYRRHDKLFAFVKESYERLAIAYDAIVIEGAGSAAEVNLRDKDIVNWPVAELADASVVLVADIDRGGIFAQVIGTLDLLSAKERRRVLGIVINKFRGDAELFADGVAFIEGRTRLPVLGVIPFLRNLELDQEDSLERRGQPCFAAEKVNIAIVLLPHMSNFTDFNVLAAEPDVALRYVDSPSELVGADVVILSGSKNTLADLLHMEQAGFPSALEEHVKKSGELVGICGGYQMLGCEVSDPHHAESGGNRAGLGLLDIFTELTPHKRTVQVQARPLLGAAASNIRIQGYEIHVGVTRRGGASPAFQIVACNGPEEGAGLAPEHAYDGALSAEGRTWGSYIHGLFDSPGFRRFWLNRVRGRKRLPPLPVSVSEEVTARLASAIDDWAGHLQRHVNLGAIFAAAGLPWFEASEQNLSCNDS